jgi:hypothetical protein
MRGNGNFLSMVGICQVQTGASWNSKYLCYPARIRVTLDKCPQTNLKQIEPWIGSFFTLRKTFFPKLQWVCIKAWVKFEVPNIKNVWLTCERIKLIFGLFCFLFVVQGFFLFFFFFLLLLHTMNEHRHKILVAFVFYNSRAK